MPKNKLKGLREKKGLSVRKLAELTGISHTQLTHIENGKRNFTTKNAEKLADFFGVSIGYLLGADEGPEPIVEEPEITDEEVEKRYFRTTKQGYRMVYMPESGMATKHGWVFLHRIVMAKSIGRDLRPEEVVHHIDGNPGNNDLSNLMLFPNNAEHRRYHAKQKRDQKIAELLKK